MNSKTQTWYWVIGIVVVAVLIFILLQSKNKKEVQAPAQVPAAETAQGNTNTQNTPANDLFAKEQYINYTDNGFAPAYLEIGQNATVIFTNNSNSPMWIASNPHPTHTDYPDFDQKSSGDSYSYTFTELGTYHFHNHMNPQDTGTIIVLPLK